MFTFKCAQLLNKRNSNKINTFKIKETLTRRCLIHDGVYIQVIGHYESSNKARKHLYFRKKKLKFLFYYLFLFGGKSFPTHSWDSFIFKNLFFYNFRLSAA